MLNFNSKNVDEKLVEFERLLIKEIEENTSNFTVDPEILPRELAKFYKESTIGNTQKIEINEVEDEFDENAVEEQELLPVEDEEDSLVNEELDQESESNSEM